MLSRLDFLQKEIDCKKAIEDLKTLTSVQEWLFQYETLYDDISIKPLDLPRIISVYFEGDFFKNINTFGHLYSTVLSVFK